MYDGRASFLPTHLIQCICEAKYALKSSQNCVQILPPFMYNRFTGFDSQAVAQPRTQQVPLVSPSGKDSRSLQLAQIGVDVKA
jgi:hypothetical protein